MAVTINSLVKVRENMFLAWKAKSNKDRSQIYYRNSISKTIMVDIKNVISCY